MYQKQQLIEEFKDLDLNVEIKGDKVRLTSITIVPTLIQQIKEKKMDDSELAKLIIRIDERPDFYLQDGVLYFKGRFCVPNVPEFKATILEEAHHTKYTVHPGNTKMYHNLKARYWWNGMKREIAKYVSRCLVCQKVKAKHQKPGGKLRPLKIPE